MRRSTPIKNDADREFPVRLRLRLPAQGFGARTPEMHRWLRDRFGTAGYALTSDNLPGVDAVSLYCGDVAAAAEFQQLFELEPAWPAVRSGRFKP